MFVVIYTHRLKFAGTCAIKRLNNELFLDISHKKKGTFISYLSV